ncbi:MAG: hypothetical protein ACYC8T_16940, partial [Myxococcaceae bacterium]
MSVQRVPTPGAGRAARPSLPVAIWRSVFRFRPVPRTELERSQAVAASFFFHVHSAKVFERTLRLRTTLGLGLFSFFTFVILVATGVLLMFYYVPAPEQAYQRMLDLRGA